MVKTDDIHKTVLLYPAGDGRPKVSTRPDSISPTNKQKVADLSQRNLPL